MSLNLPQDVIDGHLDELRHAFENGQIDKLFAAIRFCGNEGMPMPEWVVAAFFKATNAWYSMCARTLDDAFGILPPTQKRFYAMQRRRKLRPLIYNSIEMRHSKGESISKQLFSSVGTEFGVGSTVASECYSEWKGILKRLEAPAAVDKLLTPLIVKGAGAKRTVRSITARAGRPRKK